MQENKLWKPVINTCFAITASFYNNKESNKQGTNIEIGPHTKYKTVFGLVLNLWIILLVVVLQRFVVQKKTVTPIEPGDKIFLLSPVTTGLFFPPCPLLSSSRRLHLDFSSCQVIACFLLWSCSCHNGWGRSHCWGLKISGPVRASFRVRPEPMTFVFHVKIHVN